MHHAESCRTRPCHDTPLNNPPEPLREEIEVTDPTHPLFGRRFPVVSISRQPGRSAVVFVAYRDTIRLRIPVISTDLVPCDIHPPRTKWTLEAIQELLSLV